MNQETFARLVKQAERTLYRVAMSYTANEADAADAVQEALLRAWNRRHTLREEALFATWLTRIVINECKTLLRRRRRSFPTAKLPEKTEHPCEDGWIRDMLFALPSKERVPLMLHALEGYTFKEIAQMLHLPLGTVKTRVARARHKLKLEVLDDADGRT